MYDPPVRFEVGILRDVRTTGAVIRALTGVSERTQRRVAKEGLPMWQMSKNELVRERGIGRPSVLDESVCNEIDRMLCDSPDLQVSEVLRRLRSDLGYVFGKTPVYDYVRTNRPKKGQLPIVCFEGVAGEFAQHDFGELVMVYDDGASEKIHFYAGRRQVQPLHAR